MCKAFMKETLEYPGRYKVDMINGKASLVL